MSDDAAAFDSACIMWTSQLMMENLIMLTQPWARSLEVMESPTIYHALKAGLSVCPDYRRDDLKYFAPKEIYDSAMRSVPEGALLLNSIITEDPIEVAKSACQRGNSLAFLAARGIHRLQFTLEFSSLGEAHVSNPTTDNDEWERFCTLGYEWKRYLHGLTFRSNHFKVPVHPIGMDFKDSLKRDLLNIVCLDWQNEIASGHPMTFGEFPRFYCDFDMTKWEMSAMHTWHRRAE